MPMRQKKEETQEKNLSEYSNTEVSNNQPKDLTEEVIKTYDLKSRFKTSVNLKEKLEDFLSEQEKNWEKLDEEIFEEKGIRCEKTISSSLGGEDTVMASLRLEWNNWEKIEFYLEQGKEKSKEGESGIINIKGIDWNIWPSGMRIGGKNGNYYHYSLSHRGIHLMIRKPSIKNKPGEMNAYVRVGSIPLMYFGGLKQTWKVFKKLLRKLGARVKKTLISRIDMCSDFANIHVNEFSSLFLDRAYITRGSSWAFYGVGRSITGFRIGKSEVVLRIYAKDIEVRHNPIKEEILKKRRWGNEDIKCATRVEFQLRRKFLKERGVNTISEYLRERGKLINYLTLNWMRMFDDKVHKAHTGRDGKPGKLWGLVRQYFKTWCGYTDKKSEKKVTERINVDTVKLKKQAIGCICTLLSISNKVTPNSNYKDLVMEVFEGMGEILKGDYLEEKVKERRKEQLSNIPFLENLENEVVHA